MGEKQTQAVDLSKIKPGDEVLVRGIVDRAYTHASGVPAFTLRGIKRPTSTIDVEAEAIVSHTPKALEVGDQVRGKAPVGHALGGSILAIDGDAAWVRWTASIYDGSTDRRETWWLRDLERVDG